MQNNKNEEKTIKCELCQFKSSRLFHHIKKQHNLTTREYKKQFFNAKVCWISKEQIEKWKNGYKQACKSEIAKQWKPKSSWQVKFWTIRGFSEKEAKQKISSIQQKLSKRVKNRSHLKGNTNPSSLVSLSKRHNCTIEEAKKFTPAFGRVGEKHPFFGKHHTEETKQQISNKLKLKYQRDPKYAKKLQENFQKAALSNNSISKPEVEIFQFIRNQFENAQSQVVIGNYIVDILVDKTIIEFFGDYWHCNPNFFDREYFHTQNNCFAVEIWEKDKKRIKDLENLGFKILIIWEYEYYKNKEQICKLLKEELKK